jgi:integrase
LRDRFLFALLASTGMRIGQALGLRHEDIVSWERRVVIEPREDARSRARSKNRGRASILVPGELMRLWSDYTHEEYGALDADHVFVNLWEGRIGRPLSYATVEKLIARTRRRVGFHFTAHELRHAHAIEMAHEGIPLPIIQRQHAHLGITSIYLQGIDTREIVDTVHHRRPPVIPASAGLRP